MNILITGINGFVGSNFTKDWGKKHTLYGLDINQTPKAGVSKIFTWKQLGEIPDIDAIVHLAGKAHDTKSQSLAETYFEINTELTKKIFDYFLQSEAKTFVFFSSVKAAADSVTGDILTEDVAPNPVGPYGESKIKAEEYLLAKSKEQRAKNKRVFIVRPCMIHGPGNKGNLNLLFNLVKKGVPWPLGAFDNERSFCSVDNISYVVERLMVEENIADGTYHVCDDEPISTNELIKLISESVGKKYQIWKLPKGLMNGLASLGSIFHLPLNKERLNKLTENYLVSNAKIKAALGIERMPVSAREGMKKTLDSFRFTEQNKWY